MAGLVVDLTRYENYYENFLSFTSTLLLRCFVSSVGTSAVLGQKCLNGNKEMNK